VKWIGRVLAAPAILMIRIYQATISPLLPPACRFTPTCSEYAAKALAEWGPIHGTWLAIRRILRCHPWGGSGFDPVPEREDEEGRDRAPTAGEAGGDPGGPAT
jgi:putative membrane protein insertion efficiency factor